MWRPDFKLKCPAGQTTRRCTRTMAHRRRLFRGRVTLAVLGTLIFGLLMGGSIFISNRTVELRRDIAGLERRREFLQAGEGHLLTEYNAASRPEVIIKRGIMELGLVLPENPDLVLVCRDDQDHEENTSLARKFLSKFGGGTEAKAAQSTGGLVTGEMVSLTPRVGTATVLAAGGRP